jgi:prefoldin subunit 5
MTSDKTDREDERNSGFVQRLHRRIVGGSADSGGQGTVERSTGGDPAITFDSEEQPTLAVEGSTAETTTDGGVVPDGDSAEILPDTADAETTIARALAIELRSGTVEEATVETLRNQFGSDLETATEVRLDRLAARVNELETYSEAIDRLAARVDELESYTDALEQILNRAGTDDDIVATLDTIESRVERLEQEEHDTDVAQLEAAIERLADEFATLDEDLEALKEWQQDLSNVFAGVEPASITDATSSTAEDDRA